ncbi:MAG: flippase-like domain-containing protein [Actinobacteria bacterium]|nr:flippase-like domain-containing protein [Actinomycetota bacterium]
MARILDGIDAFLDQLAAIDPLPAFIAILCQLAKLTCTSQAWRNILVAAYPDREVPRRSILGAYVSGIGINAIIPIRAGDAVRVVLAHRAIPGSSYTTVISSTLVLSIFDIAAASTLLIWAVVTLDELPGIGQLPRLRSFDFAWLLDHPLAAELILAAILIALVVLGIWIHGHVLDFWERVKQAFSVVRDPPAYFGSVAIWQAADWTLRLTTVWFMLDAFDIPQSIQNVLLVQVSSSLATLLPLTPGGLGTEQAFLLYVFGGTVPGAQLLAFSVGARLILMATNVVAGFTALALTLGNLNFRGAMKSAREARAPEDVPRE